MLIRPVTGRAKVVDAQFASDQSRPAVLAFVDEKAQYARRTGLTNRGSLVSLISVKIYFSSFVAKFPICRESFKVEYS